MGGILFSLKLEGQDWQCIFHAFEREKEMEVQTPKYKRIQTTEEKEDDGTEYCNETGCGNKI